MPLDPVRDDIFTEEEGELVRHFIGMRCWCVDGQGRPSPKCPEHEAGGYIYREESTIRGLVTDVRQSRELSELGLWLPGDCVFSPQSDVVVSEMDKVVFTWALPHGEGDPLVRGEGPAERLTYEAVSALYVGDEDKVKYVEGTDFRFNGREIEWDWIGKTGTAPAAGKRYVAKYKGYLEWIAFLPPVERVSAGQRIGSKVMLRKKHLLKP